MKFVKSIFCILAVLLLINSCAILSGGAVWAASRQIDDSTLSIENAAFEQESGIQLIVVKRGLWSMQNSFKIKSIELYFLSLLDNSLTYLLNTNQNEYVKQTIQNEKIIITTNNRFNNYSDYERAILLIASTSTLALISDTSFNQRNTQNMFFSFIDSYDSREIPNIVNSQWYKNKNITITANGIIIN